MYLIDKRNVFWKKVDDETVILNIETGFYYSLEKIGSRILEMLAAGKDEQEIVIKITEEYGISKEQASKDLKDLIKQFSSEKLISIKK